MTAWAGDNILFLYVHLMGDSRLIDLDEPGWRSEHAEALSQSGTWYLIRKSDSEMVLSAVKHDGDSLRYEQRVFAFPAFGNRTLEAFGFIRERNGGHEEIWWLPFSGEYVMGDDVIDRANEWAFDHWGTPQSLPSL